MVGGGGGQGLGLSVRRKVGVVTKSYFMLRILKYPLHILLLIAGFSYYQSNLWSGDHIDAIPIGYPSCSNLLL